MKSLTPQEILDRAWNLSIPVNIDLIAIRMGVVTHKSEIAAHCRIDFNRGQYNVFLNKELPLVHQRYSLSHAMGYIFSGCLRGLSGSISFDKKDYSPDVKDAGSYQANEYALRLLMPKDALDIAIEEGMRSITELAQVFQVSEDAMKSRLEMMETLPKNSRKF